MKRETRDQAIERANANRTEAGVLSLALNFLASGREPDHVEDWTSGHEGEDSYRASLYGAKRADGGIVVITFRHEGQSPHTIARYLERWDSDLRGLHLTEFLPEKIACERIVRARNQIAGYLPQPSDAALKLGA